MVSALSIRARITSLEPCIALNDEHFIVDFVTGFVQQFDPVKLQKIGEKTGVLERDVSEDCILAKCPHTEQH